MTASRARAGRAASSELRPDNAAGCIHLNAKDRAYPGLILRYSVLSSAYSVLFDSYSGLFDPYFGLFGAIPSQLPSALAQLSSHTRRRNNIGTLSAKVKPEGSPARLYDFRTVGGGSARPPHGLLDLLGRLVLTEAVDRPERRRDPADQGDLQDQADDAGNRPADGEEQQEGNEDRDQQAHVRYPSLLRRGQYSGK